MEAKGQPPELTFLSAAVWSRRIPPAAFGRFKRFLAERAIADRELRRAIQRFKANGLYQSGAELGIDEADMASAVALFLSLPRLEDLDLGEVTAGLVPDAFARRNRVLPLGTDTGDTVFVISNPFRWDLLRSLGDTSGGRRRFALALAPPATIASFLGRAVESPETPPLPDQEPARPAVIELMDPEATGPDRIRSAASAIARLEAEEKTEELEEDRADASPIAHIAQGILEAALLDRASDIHIEPKAGSLVVRFRVDGDMREAFDFRFDIRGRIISRLKAIGGLDISEKRAPQDGAVSFKVLGRQLKLRLATTSTPHGESVVVRLLDPSKKPPALDALGMLPQQSEALRRAAERHQGLVLLVGATGSGKTTTIYSLLHSIDCQTRSLMTVEDPIEYNIAFANQQQVNLKAGVSFEALLKSAMRQDPDILYLGEIRDPFSAKTAMDFSSSGHLSISTIHASNATNLIPRLERLGIDRGTMAESVTCTTSQRLLKKPCPRCRRIEAPTDEEKRLLEPFFDALPEQVAHAAGCDQCHEGFLGREAVYEVVTWTPKMGALVAEGAPVAEVRRAIAKDGAFLFLDHARQKIADLAIPPLEVYHKVLVDEPRPQRPSALVPLSDPEPAIPTPVSSAPPRVVAAGAPRRILIVEDDSATALLMRQALETEGYEVSRATDGVEALMILGREDFDLILSDLSMPGIDGFQLMDFLAGKGLNIPVIVVTSDTREETEFQALDIGAIDVLSKPINFRRLGARVRRHIRG